MEQINVKENKTNEKEGLGEAIITLSGIFISILGVFTVNGYLFSRVLDNLLMIH